jgi:hypothetical protein
VALIDDVKSKNRVKTTDPGIIGELQDLIETAKADLMLSGILNSKIETLDTTTPDPLIKRCVLLYSQAHFGLGNADSEKYQMSYDSLKIHLCLSQEYTVEAVI